MTKSLRSKMAELIRAEFKKQQESKDRIAKKYTKRDLKQLKICYKSPNNEHSDLTFEKWIEALEENGLMGDMLD